MDGGLAVTLVSVAMFVGCFLLGFTPLLFRLSERSLQLVCLLGAGLLCGTALAIVIPEGVSLLGESYGGELPHPPTDSPAHPLCPPWSTSRLSFSPDSILLLLRCRHAFGPERRSRPSPGHPSPGRHRIGSNVGFHPDVCGGSDQHLFLHARPVDFERQQNCPHICCLSNRVHSGPGYSRCSRWIRSGRGRGHGPGHAAGDYLPGGDPTQGELFPRERERRPEGEGFSPGLSVSSSGACSFRFGLLSHALGPGQEAHPGPPAGLLRCRARRHHRHLLHIKGVGELGAEPADLHRRGHALLSRDLPLRGHRAHPPRGQQQRQQRRGGPGRSRGPPAAAAGALPERHSGRWGGTARGLGSGPER
ncbi:unnamed protein product [Tetraodon nigroviridis]|uniref:Zinc transporter ZIP9 n=1 Tax=Tetraodon nigroviridis TaxID=99883 RepID=Q4RQ33_TETNG|nr:unnamed protein product [Tetraodon nigroviridis]